MSQFDPEWKPAAFKEWQLVSDAIASGEQTVILRKGGISEGKAGFQWLHDRFFLYPSLFHEQAQQVKPDGEGNERVVSAANTNEEEVAFSVYIETIRTGRLTDWDQVAQLDPFHIWKEEIIRERFEWGDEPGISYATVKAWRLKEPWILEDRKTFGGCRSWFGLPSEEGGGWLHRLESAEEVENQCGFPSL